MLVMEIGEERRAGYAGYGNRRGAPGWLYTWQVYTFNVRGKKRLWFVPSVYKYIRSQVFSPSRRPVQRKGCKWNVQQNYADATRPPKHEFHITTEHHQNK